MASTTSFSVVPVALPMRAQPLDRPVLGGEAARAGDLLVEERARGVEGQRRGLVAQALGEGLDQGAGHAGRLGGDAERAAQRASSGPRRGRSPARSLVARPEPASAAPRRRHVALVGVGGQHALQQPHRRDAVDQGVVELGVLRDPAVAEPLDDVGLPQRPLPGQPGACSRPQSSSSSRTRPGLGSALCRRWCSMSNWSSSFQTSWPPVRIERWGCLRNSGRISSTSRIASNISRV